MVEGMSDQELLPRMRRGDAAAAAELDRRHRASLVRFAAGYVGVDDAEDAVQDVFRRVLQSGEVPRDVRVWLYVVTRNHCLNVVRGRGRRRDGARLATDAELAASLTGGLTRILRAEERDALALAMERLPADQREALRLRYTEQLGRAEIARIVDVPESVVKSRLYEGLRKLRELVAK